MVDDKVDKVPSTSTLVDPTSSSWARPVLTNARLVVEVFDSTGHFGMWQSEVLDALFQQGPDIAIEEKEYELLEITLLNRNDDVSFCKVCVVLYSKELRRKDKQISSSRDAKFLLLTGHSQKKGTDNIWRSKSRQRLSKDECAFCYEKGHWKRDCPRLKTKDNHYKGKAVAEANVTKCDDEESDLSLAASSSRNASETWLLDFACSHHITLHREWFSNFEEHEEVVYTVDETSLITHGIGLVRLQNDDRTIVTLKGVRYWPKLKKNLISVGTLESKGSKSVHQVEKMMGTQTCKKIKHLQTDNGGEYKNDLFTKFYEDEGIVRHFTVRHTPQQNRVAERMNRTLLEKVRCILSNARLGKELWAEAVTYACHLVNRFPSTAIDGKTSFEKWYGKPATDYDSLHVFGSIAYYHTKKTIFSGDVTFNESAMLKKVNVEQLDGTPKKVEFERIIVPVDKETDENSPMVEGDYEEEEVQTKEPPHQQHESITTSKPKRNTKRPAHLDDTVAYASSIVADDVPTTYSEAVRDSKNEKWRISMSEEIILLALVAQLDLELVQMDVKTTFLHGDLEVEIYMVQLEGFKVTRKEHEVYDIEKLKTRLKSEFEMKDLGEAKMILGIEIVKDRKLRKLCLTQKQYLKSDVMSPKNDADRAYMEKVYYENDIGSLMYAMICTRPDISHIVGMVSRLDRCCENMKIGLKTPPAMIDDELEALIFAKVEIC
nr:retrovirus-related Pol polyprotein from transposon TNT 1-94 [Tanacetum cinerariifolium]